MSSRITLTQVRHNSHYHELSAAQQKLVDETAKQAAALDGDAATLSSRDLDSLQAQQCGKATPGGRHPVAFLRSALERPGNLARTYRQIHSSDRLVGIISIDDFLTLNSDGQRENAARRQIRRQDAASVRADV